MKIRWILMLLAHAAGVQAAPSSTSAPTSRPAATRPAAFQPGVQIDWLRREVLVNGEVVLREGSVELFACSPRTREYESIVRLDARPLHVYQALGLIGLTPGHPIRLNEQTGQVEAATGDAVEVDVRYETDGAMRQEPIEHWLQRAKSGQPIARQPWVFAGSVPAEEGAIEADAEGTAIALVDFPSAIVALPERHTDLNEDLWLQPATDRIPAVKSACTLVFRRAPLRLSLDAAGRLMLDQQPLLSAELATRVRTLIEEQVPIRVRLRVDPRCPPREERGLRRLLEDLGVPAGAVETSRPSASAVSQHDAAAMSRWLHEKAVAETAARSPSPAEMLRALAYDLRAQSVRMRSRGVHISEQVRALAEGVTELARGNAGSSESLHGGAQRPSRTDR